MPENEDDDLLHPGVLVNARGLKVHGKTQHYKYFHEKKSPSLKLFVKHLTDMDGGKRGESHAHQVAIDVSKFLYFACPSKTSINWCKLMDPLAMKEYTKQLSKDGIGTSGILSKLDCLRLAIEFLLLEADLTAAANTQLEKTKARIKRWTSVLRKDKVGEQMRKEQENADHPVDMECMTRLMDTSTTKMFEEMARKATRVRLESSITMIAAYLFAIMMFGNSQRPGAVVHVTVDEYEKRTNHTEDGETFTIIRVSLSTSFFHIFINVIFNMAR